MDESLYRVRILTRLSKVIGFSHLQWPHRQQTSPKFLTSSLVLFSRKPSAFKISLADWMRMISVEGGWLSQWSSLKTTLLMMWSTISGYPYTFLKPSHNNLCAHIWQVQKKRLIARPMILFLLTFFCDGSQSLTASTKIASNWGTNVFFPSSTIFSMSTSRASLVWSSNRSWINCLIQRYDETSFQPGTQTNFSIGSR